MAHSGAPLVHVFGFVQSGKIELPQDAGQAGKSQAADMVLMLAGYVVRAE